MRSLVFLILSMAAACFHHAQTPLKQQLEKIVESAEGKVGVAIIAENETILINNDFHFPMMSVFKLHQAVALTHFLDITGGDIDSVIHIESKELNPDTWSPLVKERGVSDQDISIRTLLKYALISSDNNACNIMFDRLVSPGNTDKCMKKLLSDTSFSIKWTEAQMSENHELSRENATTPLSAAALMNELFASSKFAGDEYDFIRATLKDVTTGTDRLATILKSDSTLKLAHKTGSGYRDSKGLLMAHNDVGYFITACGRNYAVAVFVTDFPGTEKEASKIIADISECVYKYLCTRYDK